MDIVECIKAKLKCAYAYGQIKKFHTIIRLEFKDGEHLTQEEEDELLRLIMEEIKPKRAYVLCNRQYKELKLPWAALLHLEGLEIAGNFKELIMQGFKVKR